jgi:hypothetical protein
MNCTRRRIVTLSAFMLVTHRRGQGFPLITPGEQRDTDRRPPQYPPDSPPGTPQIELVEPPYGTTLRNPFRVHLRFHPSAGARIRPETFTVRYGVFNITNRLRRHARIDGYGLIAEAAEVPPGRYNLLLTISDTARRQGRRRLEFEVVA